MTSLFTIDSIQSGSFAIRKMTSDDVSFYNEVRNLVRQNLHDNTFFSLEETFNWFDRESPSFFIAELNGHSIGYFRTSNQFGKTIMIGMDISPIFQGKKLSKPFYGLFFELLKLNNFSKASLKVFSKNHIAHNLYMDLGFVEISRGFHTRKDGETFEEIFMEKRL